MMRSDSENDWCPFQGYNNEADSWEELMANCPIVEIPEPHGRLIDSELAEHVVGMGTQVTLSKKERILAIQGLPTVIEAEGGQENENNKFI